MSQKAAESIPNLPPSDPTVTRPAKKTRPRRKRPRHRALVRVLRTVCLAVLGVLATAVLLALSPLLLLLLSVPVHLRATCEENKFDGSLRYAFLRFPLGGRKPAADAEAPPETAQKRKSASKKTKSAEKKQPLSERLALVRPFAEAAWAALRCLLRRVRVEELDVRVRPAAADPADAALLHGRLYAAAGIVYSLLGSRGRLGRFHFESTPDFNAEKTVCSGRASLSLRPFWLLCAALFGGVKLLGGLVRSKLDQDPSGANAPNHNIPGAAQTGGANTRRKGGKTMSHPIENLMGTSMQKIREMVDVNTMIGDPIHITDKITVIPISRASFGFASGGSDLPSKQEKALFGGGAGAGVKIDPVAFIVVNGDDVQLLPYAPAPAPGADRAISMVPGLIEQISGLFKKKDAPANEPEHTEENSAE